MTMSSSQTILGITPVTMRLAYEYAKKGIGWHAIEHPFYDEVCVREIVTFQKLPVDVAGVQYGAVLQVAFYKNGQRVRYIDFATLATGGGGEPAISLVPSLSESTPEH